MSRPDALFVEQVNPGRILQRFFIVQRYPAEVFIQLDTVFQVVAQWHRAAGIPERFALAAIEGVMQGGEIANIIEQGA